MRVRGPSDGAYLPRADPPHDRECRHRQPCVPVGEEHHKELRQSQILPSWENVHWQGLWGQS